MATRPWMITVALLAACAGEADPPDAVTDPFATDTDHTDHEPEDTGELPDLRPLCAEDEPATPFAADLVAWAEVVQGSNNRFYGELEWAALEAMGEDDLGATDERVVMNRILRGWHRLKFGDLEGAIADLDAAEALAVQSVPQWRMRARQLLAVAWIRKAETDNCLTNPHASSCIVPFDAHGEHANVQGMQSAAEALERLMTEDSPTVESPMWLYNLTFMARGMWPDEMAPTWRLPLDLLDSEAELTPWANHAPGLRIRHIDLAGGTALEDLDGDGRLDLLMSSFGPLEPMHLFLNMGNGWFCNASRQSGVAGIPGVLDFKAADYDNDGDVDIFAPRGAWMGLDGNVRDSLLRNDGEGRFTDVAVAAGLTGPDVDGPTQVSAWADYDNDGWVDLFVGREDQENIPAGRRPSSLYHNNGDGTFTDVGRDAGVSSSGFVKGASWFDYDDDGDPDLYTSSLRGLDRLYRNNGDGTFTDRSTHFGVLEPVKSFPSLAFDYDQDGDLDLYVASFTINYGGGGPLDPVYFQSMESYVDDLLGNPIDPAFAETARLYRNDGDGFTDVTQASGLDDIHATMGLSVGDLNGDGYPDLYLGTGAPEYDALEPNCAYLNDGAGRFHDVTTIMRTGNLQKGHGVSFGDLDEDGDEDLVVEMGGAFPGDGALSSLYVNPTNTAAERAVHAVTLRLEGVTANRSAIGARVAVVTPERTFFHTVGETGSFGGNSLQVEVALATSTTITRVEVRWPGAAEGVVETLNDVPVDSVVHIRQGAGVVDSRPYAPWTLKGKPHEEDAP